MRVDAGRTLCMYLPYILQYIRHTAGMLIKTKELECGTKMRNITDPSCSALLHSMFSLELNNIKILSKQKQLSCENIP